MIRNLDEIHLLLTGKLQPIVKQTFNKSVKEIGEKNKRILEIPCFPTQILPT